MALDEALSAAIHDAVVEEGQPKAVAARLIAWLDALSNGDEPIDREAQFYANLLAAVVVEGDDDED